MLKHDGPNHSMMSLITPSLARRGFRWTAGRAASAGWWCPPGSTSSSRRRMNRSHRATATPRSRSYIAHLSPRISHLLSLDFSLLIFLSLLFYLVPLFSSRFSSDLLFSPQRAPHPLTRLLSCITLSPRLRSVPLLPAINPSVPPCVRDTG